MTTRSRRTSFSFSPILAAIVLACISLNGHIAVAHVSSPAGFAYDRYDVLIGKAERQSVLTGMFRGGAIAELAVVKIDEAGNRLVRLHTFEGKTWSPTLQATLGPGVVFVDVANIGGRDRLITYQPGRLSVFDPESKSERALTAVESSFIPPRTNEIPHVDITRDVNGDGRDDFVVPATNGFWGFIQLSGGTFADPVNIGSPPDMSGIYGADGYRYDPWPHSRIHEMDYNLDGRTDLVFWNKDHFDAHLQDETGRFSEKARSFATAVKFDSDNPYFLAQGDMSGRVLQTLTDMNGDGIGDLVIHSLQGRRIRDKRSTYEVHYGRPTPEGGTAFAPNPSVKFQSQDRILIGMERYKFDRDGGIAVMFTTISIEHLTGSLWKSFKGFMGADVGLNLEFYRTQNGQYRGKPNAIHSIALDGVPSHREPGSVPLDVVLRGPTHERRRTQQIWRRAFNRNLLIGDVTGDGRLDLVREPEFRDLLVYPGVPGPSLFSPRPAKVSVILPHDGEYTWLTDLNRDGKEDIVMHHPFIRRNVHGAPTQPPGTETQRLTILLAR